MSTEHLYFLSKSVCQKWGLNPRPHTRTRMLWFTFCEQGKPWVWRLRPLGHPDGCLRCYQHYHKTVLMCAPFSLQLKVAMDMQLIMCSIWTLTRSCNGYAINHSSRVAQWKRAGPITQRSIDRNYPLLNLCSSWWKLAHPFAPSTIWQHLLQN